MKVTRELSLFHLLYFHVKRAKQEGPNQHQEKESCHRGEAVGHRLVVLVGSVLKKLRNLGGLCSNFVVPMWKSGRR